MDESLTLKIMRCDEEERMKALEAETPRSRGRGVSGEGGAAIPKSERVSAIGKDVAGGEEGRYLGTARTPQIRSAVLQTGKVSQPVAFTSRAQEPVTSGPQDDQEDFTDDGEEEYVGMSGKRISLLRRGSSRLALLSAAAYSSGGDTGPCSSFPETGNDSEMGEYLSLPARATPTVSSRRTPPPGVRVTADVLRRYAEESEKEGAGHLAHGLKLALLMAEDALAQQRYMEKYCVPSKNILCSIEKHTKGRNCDGTVPGRSYGGTGQHLKESDCYPNKGSKASDAETQSGACDGAVVLAYDV